VKEGIYRELVLYTLMGGGCVDLAVNAGAKCPAITEAKCTRTAAENARL